MTTSGRVSVGVFLLSDYIKGQFGGFWLGRGKFSFFQLAPSFSSHSLSKVPGVGLSRERDCRLLGRARRFPLAGGVGRVFGPWLASSVGGVLGVV